MDTKEKSIAKQKLAICLRKLIDEQKLSKDENAVNSLRDLAASSGVEYSIIQKITTGKKDPQYTTLVSLAEGFNMELSKFLTGINSIKDQELKDFQKLLQKKKSNKRDTR